MAFGERNTIESCIQKINGLKNSENKRVLELVVRLFAVDVILRDLSFYLLNGAISMEAAKTLK
jgi:hypothetical protein